MTRELQLANTGVAQAAYGKGRIKGVNSSASAGKQCNFEIGVLSDAKICVVCKQLHIT